MSNFDVSEKVKKELAELQQQFREKLICEFCGKLHCKNATVTERKGKMRPLCYFTSRHSLER